MYTGIIQRIHLEIDANYLKPLSEIFVISDFSQTLSRRKTDN